jgi:hypothetical protein
MHATPASELKDADTAALFTEIARGIDTFLDKPFFFSYLYPCTDRSLLPQTLALFVKAGFVAIRS